MKVLIVKTSSMGDVLHTLPALTDACSALPGIKFDWVVEPAFQEIPSWHKAVERVIPVALRQWRKQFRQAWNNQEIQQCWRWLRNRHYTAIIDAQGLLKSALISRCAKGVRVGFCKRSARESAASYLYQHKVTVPKKQHAINRLRSLFAQHLNYPMPQHAPDYGIDWSRFTPHQQSKPYLVFLHGTTWATKHWPDQYWLKLAQLAGKAGYEVQVTWATPEQQQRATWLAEQVPTVKKLPHLTIGQAAQVLGGAAGVVAVDTGFAHLATALSKPTVAMHGPTDPVLTGVLGKEQINLQVDFSCAPCLNKQCTYQGNKLVEPACFATLPPEQVWAKLTGLMQQFSHKTVIAENLTVVPSE